jgi:hypothetical protein
MFASTVSNKPVAVAQPISPQKQMIEFQKIPIKQVYHLSIFMLPNVQFDPDYTALIYYQIVPETGDNLGMRNSEFTHTQIVQNDFKLLGFLNASKQSAIFKINPGNIDIPVGAGTHDEGDIDMESGISEFEERETVTIVIGISIESNQNATQQLDCLKVTRDSTNSLPLVRTSTPKVSLSQNEIFTVSNKIIGNAYNYLSSFTDMNNNVNISKFNDWWDKFKIKMGNDPNYLQNLE